MSEGLGFVCAYINHPLQRGSGFLRCPSNPGPHFLSHLAPFCLQGTFRQSKSLRAKVCLNDVMSELLPGRTSLGWFSNVNGYTIIKRNAATPTHRGIRTIQFDHKATPVQYLCSHVRVTSSVGTMFSKANLLTAVVLAIFASAVPTEFETGLSIPLHKRGSLTRDDGVFDSSKVTLAIGNVKNKYRQNLINFVRNVGYLHGDARILPAAGPPATAISKRQQENLMDEVQDGLYAGNITIGSNNQQFSVAFDSELSSPPFSQCLPTPLLYGFK